MTRFILWLLLECSAVVVGWGQVDYTADSPYRALVEGSIGWTLRAETGVYVGPHAKTALCTTLAAARPLFLLERLDETETRQGFRHNWYRVRYADPSPTDLGEGFVWGGDLALEKIQTCAPSLQITYGLDKIRLVQRETYEEPQLELLIVASRQGQVVASTRLDAVGSIYTQARAQLRGHQGLAGIHQVLEIAFNDGYCGGVAATATLLWDGQHWHPLDILSQGFGDNAFSNAYYKYPTEHQRGNNLLELYREEGYYNRQQQAVYTKKSIEIYEWTGKQLFLVEGATQD